MIRQLRFALAGLSLTLGLAQFAHAGGEIVALSVPPPGTQTGLSSAEVRGFVVGTPGPQIVTEVMVRTRYANGQMHPPINNAGAYDPSAIGWAYPVEWNALTGVGTFTGRAKWLADGTNYIDVYLPGDTLGNPSYSQTIVYQLAAETPSDVVAGVHPLQRSVDVVDIEGNTGALEFRVDLINTTVADTYNIDLVARVTMPNGAEALLPMGGTPGSPANFVIAPGDFQFTSVIDPVSMTYSFPLDEEPFPALIEEGAYRVCVEVYDGPALIFFEENLSYWVSDRSTKPFRDVTKPSGLVDVHLQGGQRPSPGNSIAAFDYDNDGLTDLFFTNPSGSETFLAIGDNWPFPGGRNFLMQNMGDGTFSDETAAAGVVGNPDTSSYGIAWGDLNDDGHSDFLVANRMETSYVYRNDGDGTFTDVAGNSFAGPPRWNLSPRFGDIDEDGDLDCYIGAYLSAFDTTWANTGYSNRLYRNEFVEGGMDPSFPDFPLFTQLINTGTESEGDTLGNFFADFNGDDNIDLFVHHDFGPMATANELFRGDGEGGFLALPGAGYAVREFSMGSTSADFTGDLSPDLYSSSMGRNSLLINNGAGIMTQMADGSGAEGAFVTEGPGADGQAVDDSWGAQAWDYDLDGDVDIYNVGSYIFTAYNMPVPELNTDAVYRNDGFATFTKVSEDLGLANAAQGRGVVMLDYDNDGDLDVVTSNENEGVTLMRNDLVTLNSYIKVRPVVTRSSPGGFNTKIDVVSNGLHQRKELMTSSAAASQGDNSWFFGIRTAPSAKVRADWQRGGSTVYYNIPANSELELYETVIEVEGRIDAEVPVGISPDIRLLGESGMLFAAAVGSFTIPGPLPLPGGGELDIFPNFETVFANFFDANGEATWTLATMSPAWVGLTFELQMLVLNETTGFADVTSGVSTITVVP